MFPAATTPRRGPRVLVIEDSDTIRELVVDALATEGNVVRLPGAAMQPIAARDVSTAVTRVVVGEPLNGTVNIAGPQRFGVDEFARAGLAAHGDPREVVTDARARYFGAVLDDEGIAPVASDDVIVYPTRFADWAAVQNDGTPA